MRNSLIALILTIMLALPGKAGAAQYMREITVSQDGTGDFTTITEALEAIRAFMDYRVTVNIRNGVYHEKVVIPAWVHNVDFIGQSADSTIITWADHANINKMGTFRTYTLKVDGCGLTFANITVENNAPRLGQAVALHTEGDRLIFVNCRFLGNQDTIYTAGHRSRLLFDNCYIEGTTDFIFGPATALFTACELRSKSNSYITAASTPADVEVGYVFYRCRLTADEGVDKVYLGRPWRPYASTTFIDCEMGPHITAAGWHNWKDPENEKTARYGEYGSTGPGAQGQRVEWARTIDSARAAQLTDPAYIYNNVADWTPVTPRKQDSK
ncbi:MAG: pectin esterase [Duncaniella sp.]|nr:pectin esterase [Duncaniella sp.]